MNESTNTTAAKPKNNAAAASTANAGSVAASGANAGPKAANTTGAVSTNGNGGKGKNNAAAAAVNGNGGKGKNNAAAAPTNGNAETNSSAPLPEDASIQEIKDAVAELKKIVETDGSTCANMKEKAKKVVNVGEGSIATALKNGKIKEDQLANVTKNIKSILDPITKACKTNGKPAVNATVANATVANATVANAAPEEVVNGAATAAAEAKPEEAANAEVKAGGGRRRRRQKTQKRKARKSRKSRRRI